jgi:argininosuccinate lyase
MKLWGGRFSSEPDPQAWAFNRSLAVDQRMAQQDVQASQAWAHALQAAGLLTDEEGSAICTGLQSIADEFNAGSFAFQDSDEDIHTAVERRLGELIGALAGKLHTGRSRNDQVVTDFRLWLMEQISMIDQAISSVQSALLQRAEEDFGVLLPGFTHTQHAQPVLFSHWWLAHLWALQRDRQRLAQLWQRTAVLPLGSGALAGTSFPIDRAALAEELGFLEPSPNSLDAVADRDFAAELLFDASLCGVHLSKLAEALILFSTPEFGYIELADAFTTGSSLMPQKKNPDMLELTRAKAGVLLGSLTGLMAVLKGLPGAYDKDLQEDKAPVFQACDTLNALLPVVAGVISTLHVNADRALSVIDEGMLATDLADVLVGAGVPFREAHGAAGKVVRLAAERGVPLSQLSLDDYQSIHPAFDAQVFKIFDPKVSVARHASVGGTAPEAVRQQMQAASLAIQSISYPLSK